MKKINPYWETQLSIPKEKRWKSISNAFGILLLFIGLAGSVSSQTVQIGSGTATTNYIPFYYLYNYGYSQTIYTSSELIASGMDPNEGLITKVRYKATTSQSTVDWKDWEIYMGNTTKIGFDTSSDWIDIASVTPVFNGVIASNVVAGQWLEITLTTPFQWDGTSNIVVAVNQTTGTYGNNPGWAAYTNAPSAGNKSIYKYQDATGLDPITPPTASGRSNTVAQIQFDGNLQVACAGTPVVAPITAPLSACLGVNVQLGGTLVASAGISYQWQESSDGTTWTDISGATTVSYNVAAGITADTYYRLNVTCSNGGATASSNELMVGFVTGATCICTPVGASNTSTDEIRSFMLSNLTNPSPAAEGVNGYSDYTTTAATAQLMKGVGYVAQLLAGPGSGNHGAAIWIDYNDNGVFEASERVAFLPNSITANATASFPSFSVPLSVTEGQHRLRVQYSYNKSGDILDPCVVISNSETEDYMVDVLAAPSCVPPSAFAASNITSTSVDLVWTEMNSSTVWNIEYGAPGYVQGSGTEESGVTNPYVLTGLSPQTSYDIYVQTDCGTAGESIWTGPISITTECATYMAPFYESFDNAVKPACWKNLSSNTTSTIASNFWDFDKQGEHGALLNGKAKGTFVSSDGSSPNPDSMMLYTPWIDLSALTNPELRFEWFSNNTNAPANNVPLIINIYDGTTWTNLDTLKGNYPSWTEVFYDLSAYANSTVKVLFMTNQSGVLSAFQNDILLDEVSIDEMVTCNTPTLLTATNITASSADLSWTGAAAEYQVEYGALGFAIGTGTSSIETTNSFDVTVLAPETEYDFYVRAICSAGDTSMWTSALSLTTLCLPYSIPYFEGFETGYTHDDDVAGCILQEDVSGTTVWSANNTLTTYNRTPRTGSWNAFLRYNNTDWMFIPVDLVGGTSYTMEVYARQDGSTATNAGLTLSYGTAGNDAAMTNTIAAATGLVDGNYQLVDGEFTPTTTGVYYIGIKGVINSTPWYISVDDISIYETPPCDDPSALSASNFTTTSADLAWTENGNATTWNIEYGPAGFTQGAGTAMAGVTTNPYTLTGLMPCMNYEYYVQADCGSGDLSAFVGAFAFTTIAAPATGTDTQVACDTFDWIDGNTYTSSNTTATFTIVGGGSSVCGNDSIVTLDLTINNSVTSTDVQVACETYTWIDGVDYTTDNNTATFTIVGGAANGCDSIVTLDLTIEQGPNAGGDIMETFCLNQPVDLSTLLSSGADTGGTYYGPGGSALTSSSITVSNQGGTYVYKYVTASSGICPADTALITITADAGCDYLSVDTEMLVDISVYPNPATSILTILNPSNTSSLKVEMLDMNGRVVLVENKALNNATEATIAIENLERGIYTLRVYNTEGQRTFKIVKQ